MKKYFKTVFETVKTAFETVKTALVGLLMLSLPSLILISPFVLWCLIER